MFDIHLDDFDGQNVWLDFRPLDIEDRYPAMVSTLGDRRIKEGEFYHCTSSDLRRMSNNGFFCILQYTLGGCGYFIYHDPKKGKQEFKLPPGKCFFITAEDEFEFFTPGNCAWDYIYFSFRGELAEHVFRKIRTHGPVLELPRDSEAVNGFQLLISKALRRTITARELRQHACRILLDLEDDVRLPGQVCDDDFIRQASKWMQDNISSCSAKRMAAHYGFSEKYFQVFFKKKAGLTPGQFLLKLRMQHVKNLLECSCMKLSSIAELTGFADASHLCRCFRKQFQTTPENYRQGNCRKPDY